MKLIHLDTDLGGDADDLCALAMLLGDPEVEISGITTSADVTGLRAEFVRHVLRLAGRHDIPVAAGAASFLGGIPHDPGTHDARYFPGFDFEAPLERTRPGAFLDLLTASIKRDAGVLAIGPYTNLAMIETIRPGDLSRVPVTVMGGHLGTPPPGYPQWGANMDYNIQADRMAASILFERLDPLIVPLRACFGVALRHADVPALEVGGPIARLIARQAALQFADSGFERLVRENHSLAADFLNFQWDPVASGAALAWDCLRCSALPLQLVEREGQLAFEERPGAPLRRVVTDVDVEGFRQEWLARVLRV